MSNRDIESLADEAFEALGESPAHEETWRQQLSKACQLLHDLRTLEVSSNDDTGRATTLVELSLAVIERTLQAVLMRGKGFEATDFQHHLFAIQTSGERGIISKDLARSLEQIWREHRNENDYRAGLPTANAARKMIRLAGGLHERQVRRAAAYRGACTCDRDRRRPR